MSTAHFRFYAELNACLPADRQFAACAYTCNPGETVKHAIESLGVPHTEVDLILVNGVSVDFAHPIQPGDQVSVFPVFEALDISPVIRLRPQPLREPRFILDTHLGKLAAFLRLLGFDCLYRNDIQDEELARLSAAEARILLTRDRGVLKRNQVTHGYLVRDEQPRRQVLEVLRRFDLFAAISPFRRCLRCNQELQPIEKAAILHRLQPDTRRYYAEFFLCPGCDQIYWQGSHFQRMAAFVTWVKERDEKNRQD